MTCHLCANKTCLGECEPKLPITMQPSADDMCDCTDKSQCWEPCGELGKSIEHVAVFDQTPVYTEQQVANACAASGLTRVQAVNLLNSLAVTNEQAVWPSLMVGARVVDDTAIIKSRNNDDARNLCTQLVELIYNPKKAVGT